MDAPILLVEDSSTDAAIMLTAFRCIGYAGHIEIVKDGIQALNWLEQLLRNGIADLPRLILLDLNLPRKSGHEMLQEIKGHHQLRRIPVIIVSSSSREDDIAKSYELYANAYIAKPIVLEEYKLTAQHIYDFWLKTAKVQLL
ncbi:response regulator [Leptolyngbyaceae cyanobacterium CCMR0082]|uniref:Response regulator n=1 Tax=Adonisia turfae CCMR0082 TaxID=2304604 RepID=A0A6M0SEM8_9CYAN|nr:response regulator [Adonisia turfae]NEZ66451.1 response regulator [Adonisia turfae CCMR0082]